MNEAQGGEPEKAALDELGLGAAELQASRARVISAAHAFRRRIEGRLHDGVQQDLVALAVNLQLAQQLAESDSPAAKELLAEMGSDVEKAQGDLRRLAWEVYPSLLRDRGLGESLRAAAAEAPIRTRVESKGIGRYPSDVEEAVFFCCVETLRDLTEMATSATVRLSTHPGAIRFEVIVDLGPEAFPRPELQDARDCLGAVGGTLTVSSRNGRTLRVSGEIRFCP